MKTFTLSLTAAVLLLGASLTAFALTRHPMLEGKDRPILLQRMIVTATLLPS